MFDPANLKDNEKKILSDFYSKRALFDTYIQDKALKIFTCPGCGYPTLNERGNYEICDLCNWEDDNQDNKEADEVWGGPNGNLSLTAHRIKIGSTLVKNGDPEINSDLCLFSICNSLTIPISRSMCPEKLIHWTNFSDFTNPR